MTVRPIPLVIHVDDREENRYLVEKILVKAGYDVLDAATGADGLALIREKMPDLIILDIHLPDMTGFEVCRQLKSNLETEHIPVLQISSQLTNLDSRVEGLDSGADAYLTAIRPPEIVATVKALLRARRAEDLAISKAAEWGATFNAVGDPILLIHSSGEIYQTNLRAEKLLAGLSQDDKDALVADFARACKIPGGGSSVLHYHDIQVMNSTYRMSVDLLPDAEAGKEKYVVVLTDVTTLVEAEAAIRRSNEALKEAHDEALSASRSKSVFMSSMSHELRTPLNAIMGYAELLYELSSDRDDKEAAKDLTRIMVSARHLLSLISDILDIAKIEAGRTSMHFSDFDVRKLVMDIVSTLEPLASSQKTDIVVRINDNVGTMHSDSTKVRQILWNLLGNACKFTQKGTITLVVSRANENGVCSMRFDVEDTGIGISSEKLDIVFDAFEQAGQHSQGSFGGTGLGLAISKRLAELLGGALTVISKPGDGSTFTLILPVSEAGTYVLGTSRSEGC